MRNRYGPRIVLLCTLIIGIIFQANYVLAGIGVDPTITEIEVAPGHTKAGSFRVANGGEETALVKVELEDWLKLRVGESPVDVEDYLFIDESEFELEPGEVKNIGYQIMAPEGIEGELVAMAFFSSAVPSEGAALGVTSRFGVAVYVGIEGTEIIDAEIEDIKLNGSQLAIVIENKGNVHIRPRGRIILRDRRNKIIHESKVPYSAVIFAGKAHTYPLNLSNKGLARGKYKCEAVFDTGTIYEKSKTFKKTVNIRIK